MSKEKTEALIKHMEDENIGSYELYLCIKALKMEKTILMLLVDNMDMKYIEEVVQHKKEDWG
jgi:hypothetical protein